MGCVVILTRGFLHISTLLRALSRLGWQPCRRIVGVIKSKRLAAEIRAVCCCCRRRPGRLYARACQQTGSRTRPDVCLHLHYVSGGFPCAIGLGSASDPRTPRDYGTLALRRGEERAMVEKRKTLARRESVSKDAALHGTLSVLIANGRW